MDSQNRAEKNNLPPVSVKPSRLDGDILGIRSTQFRTWLSFVVLTVLTLVILWLTQIIFYTVTFRDMSKSDMKRAGDELLYRLKTGHFVFPSDLVDMLKSSAIGGGYSAIILDEKCSMVLIFANANGTSSVEYSDKELFEKIIAESEKFRSEVVPTKESVVYTEFVAGRGDFIVYGAPFGSEENKLYLCLAKPFVQSASAVGILRNQLIIVTVVCLLLSMVLSLMFSRKITKPITSFSAAAEKLVKGDFSVQFKGNGWTEIDELADTLNYATEEMGKTEALRRDFFANVSHDFRTPLTIIRTYSEMIRDISGADEEKRNKHAQIIMDEADRLTLLVGDILELSKLESNVNEQTIEEVDIAGLLNGVVARFSEMATRDGCTVIAEADCSSKVDCDRRAIEKVLYNLIANAVNYTGEDGVVTAKAFETALCVRVEVRDSGIGIPKEERDKVWDRYYRSGRTKRATKGTGLGLSIVKSILLQHGARFGVESVVVGEGEKTGTMFWFELKKSKPQLMGLPVPEAKKKSDVKSKTSV